MSETVGRRPLALLASACVVLRLPALLMSRFYDPDEAAIAVQARTIVAGGRLYVDMADRKPPIPPFVYAWWFQVTSSNDIRGPRLFVALLLALAAVALTLEVARAHGSTAGLWAGSLYVLGAYAFGPADAGAANYAHFALPLATIALLCCRRAGWRYSLAGGLMLGLAILSRQSWIFAVPAAALSCWFAAKAKGVATHAIGLAAGIGLAALFAPWSEYWFWNFKSSPGFVFASVDVGWVVSRGLAAVGIFVAFHLALVVAAGSTLPASLRREPDLWLWALTGLAATSAGFRFYGHYWLQLLPPLVLLAAPVLAAASVRRQRLAQASLAVGAVVALVLLFVPHAFRDRPDPAPLAATIRQCTAVDQRVFVWGSFPELSVLVDRPAAGRLVHMDFVTGRSGGRSGGSDAVTPGARTKMMDDLRADPPTVLVDTSGVSNLGYQAFPMLGQPELGDFARAGYTPQAVAGGFVLWWINGHVPCAAATP